MTCSATDSNAMGQIKCSDIQSLRWNANRPELIMLLPVFCLLPAAEDFIGIMLHVPQSVEIKHLAKFTKAD